MLPVGRGGRNRRKDGNFFLKKKSTARVVRAVNSRHNGTFRGTCHPYGIPDVLSVFVDGNDTVSWSDKERNQKCEMCLGGRMYPGILSVIDHDKQIVNVDFSTPDTEQDEFFLVKKIPGQTGPDHPGHQVDSPVETPMKL